MAEMHLSALPERFASCKKSGYEYHIFRKFFTLIIHIINTHIANYFANNSLFHC